MGLDQFWRVMKYNGKEFSQQDSEELYQNSTELHYHRKVPALESFFDEMRSNIGQEQCSSIQVTEEILDDLEERAIEQTLDQDAAGFFWGQHSDEDYPDILDAVRKAKEAIKEGNIVYYRSSW